MFNSIAITRLSQTQKQQDTRIFKGMNKAWRKNKPSSKSKHEIWKPRTITQNVQNIDSKDNIIMKTWKKQNTIMVQEHIQN